MCGIAVIFNAQRVVETKQHLLRMLNIARHRGPNDQGVFISGNSKCGMGMNRLSIIDVENGQQPIESEDSNLVLVCNGEIYNHEELRNSLKQSGHIFRTNSDVEVVLHLYEEKGIKGFEALDGMFAFAIYDKDKEELVVGRDRFGIKPVYYSKNEYGQYFIGSEPKSILEVLGTNRVNKRVFFEYLIWGFAISGEPVWKDIEILQAGTCMKINAHSSNNESFLLGKNVNHYTDKDEAKADLRSAVIRSIESQLMSDVPLGVFLSGGIDSTIMVGVISKILGRDVKTFSIDFEGDSYSEIEKINSVSNEFDTEQRTFLADKTVFSVLDDLIKSCDEPFGDPAALPTLYLSKKTVEHVTVALSGDGSDEFMYGYGYHHIGSENSFFKNSLFNGIARQFKLNNPWFYSILSRTAPGQFFPSNIYYLLKDELFNDFTPQPTFNSFIEFERKSYLQNNILFKTDRTTMFHSLEARVPFLGNDVVDVAYGVSKSFQVQKGQGKLLLKEAFNDVLSKDIIQQKKHGFTTPVGTWILQDYEKNTFRKLIFSAGFARLLNEKWINRIIDEHFSGKFNHGKFIYRLLVSAKWDRMYSPNYQI